MIIPRQSSPTTVHRRAFDSGATRAESAFAASRELTGIGLTISHMGVAISPRNRSITVAARIDSCGDHKCLYPMSDSIRAATCRSTVMERFQLEWKYLNELLQETWRACRTFRRTPGPVLLAFVTLTLSISSSATTFGL